MKKKILIGSIIAVVILTLVSFSSVVGFQSVKTDSKIASPLFSVRNKKGDVSSDYLGKGKTLNILLPRRNDKAELLEKLIDRINEMNDGEFENLDKRYLINALTEIKNKPYAIDKLFSIFNVFDENEKPVFPTIGEPWYPGCISGVFLNIILTVLLGIFMAIVTIITMSQPTWSWQCGGFN